MTDGISTPGSFRTNEEQTLIYFVKYEYYVNDFVTGVADHICVTPLHGIILFNINNNKEDGLYTQYSYPGTHIHIQL